MKRTPLVLALAVLSALTPVRHTLAAGSVADALPAHARLLDVVGLPGDPQRSVVAYDSDHSYLAIISTSGRKAVLLWMHRLRADPAVVTAPGPSGVFEVVVRPSGAPDAWLYTYSFHDGQVSSAIAGRTSGWVHGDEGVVLKPNGFVVHKRDSNHKGSVRYRLLVRYSWQGSVYATAQTRRVPDYAAGAEPVPNGTVRTASDDVVLIRLEVATTEQQRETGLMFRTSLDPDSGMLFSWTAPVLEAFWMENTYIPLTIAFLSADGRIQEMQDMAPLTTTYHMPAQPYQYAIEVNQGFFARSGVKVGDRVVFHLGA